MLFCRYCASLIALHDILGVAQDAMQSVNGVLDAEPDSQAAFNLVLCTFALGDKEMMKQAFSRLVEVRLPHPPMPACFDSHNFC